MKIKYVYYKYRHRIRNARKYGLRMSWDKKYAQKVLRKVRNRKSTLRDRARWGGSARAGAAGKHKTKTLLFKINGNKCFYCGRSMTYRGSTMDHIIPFSEGGGSDIGNLRLIHDPCRIERDRAINKGILNAKNG